MRLSVPVIPKRLEDWTIDNINGLLNERYIESETFDFKSSRFQEKNNELYNDICAMANTSGGFIVLGVDENKNEKTDYLLGFRKNGFKKGEEDKINQKIGSNVYNVEPIPKVPTPKIINDNEDLDRFYIILRVDGEDIYKPYFIKGANQCYIRVGNSIRPAGRAIVINLLSGLREKRINIERLRVSSNTLKESIMYTAERIRDIDPNNAFTEIPPLNLDYIRDAVISAEWFLVENNLLGGHIRADYTYGGFHSFIYDLEMLNASIRIYNKETLVTNKERVKNDMRFWQPKHNNYKQSVGFLDNIIIKCNQFFQGCKGMKDEYSLVSHYSNISFADLIIWP